MGKRLRAAKPLVVPSSERLPSAPIDYECNLP